MIDPFAIWDPLHSRHELQQRLAQAKSRRKVATQTLVALAVAALLVAVGQVQLARFGVAFGLLGPILLLVSPWRGLPIWHGMQHNLAQLLQKVLVVALLTPLFVLVLWPLGLWARLRGEDPLRLKPFARPASLFVPCEPSDTQSWRPY
jgi:hypothetical protein